MRDQYGLFPDSEVVMEPRDDGVLMRPLNSKQEQIEQWLGKAVGAGNGKFTTDEIMALTRGKD